MGLFDWLRGLFGKRPVVEREVAGLDVDDGDLDQRREVIATDGPLRPGGRRRALRDPALLPKPAAERAKPRNKRRRQLTRDEATRLFAGTLVTRNRALRDVATDVDALARRGLPAWRDEAELAAGLGLTVKQLRHFSIHRAAERVTHYVCFARPKRSGGERLIHAPKRRLKAVLRRVDAALGTKLPVHEAAHGFRRGRSPKTNAEAHAGAAVFVRLDLRDFFPSITAARVRGYLVGMGYGYPVAATLAVLVTEPERQPVDVDGTTYHVPVGPRTTPQGAPTSPTIANALVERLDRRLAGLARRRGLRYTRYADDLTFSSTDPALAVSALVGAVRRVVEDEGFALNPQKTRVRRRSARITGVTARPDGSTGLSKRERRKIRALADAVVCGRAPERRAELDGWLAYLTSVDRAHADALRAWIARRAATVGSPTSVR
jgi:RNA-directed DNA polymerase